MKEKKHGFAPPKVFHEFLLVLRAKLSRISNTKRKRELGTYECFTVDPVGINVTLLQHFSLNLLQKH